MYCLKSNNILKYPKKILKLYHLRGNKGKEFLKLLGKEVSFCLRKNNRRIILNGPNSFFGPIHLSLDWSKKLLGSLQFL